MEGKRVFWRWGRRCAWASWLSLVCWGLAVAWWADARWWTLLGVLARDGVIVASLTGGLFAWWRARAAVAPLLVVLVVWGSGGLTDAPVPVQGRVVPDCAPLSVITWNTHGMRADDARRARGRLRRGDVVALQEVRGKLGASLPGVRQVAVYGGAGAAWWAPRGVSRAVRVVSLPTLNPARRAAAVITVWRGVPLVNLHMDRPAALAEVVRWPALLEESAAVLVRLRAELGERVVMVGDTNTTPGFRRFWTRLARGGLAVGTPVRSWPVVLRGVPALPVVALDRVITGPAWHIESIEPRPSLRGSDHLAIRARLVCAVQAERGGARGRHQ